MDPITRWATARLPADIGVAFRLARGFGHAWAMDLPDLLAAFDAAEKTSGERPTIDGRIIAAWSDVCRPEWPGIGAPTWDAAGHIVHTSSSGRIAWNVRPDGGVRITIGRPAGACLEAIVDPEGDLESVVGWAGLMGQPGGTPAPEGRGVEARHIEALLDALRHLGIRDSDVEPRLAALGLPFRREYDPAVGDGWQATRIVMGAPAPIVDASAPTEEDVA